MMELSTSWCRVEKKLRKVNDGGAADDVMYGVSSSVRRCAGKLTHRAENCLKQVLGEESEVLGDVKEN